MKTDSFQILLPQEQHHVYTISQLKQAITDNPQAVMNYIMYRGEENEAARRDLKDTRKELIQLCRPKPSRAFEQRIMKQEQKATVVAELPNTKDSIEPFGFVIVTSVMFLITFSNIVYGISPWSTQFELIRKNCLTGPIWHWIIPFSFILFLFTVGYSQSSLYRIIPPADNQKDNTRLGIKRRAARFAVKQPYPLGYLIDRERGGYYALFSCLPIMSETRELDHVSQDGILCKCIRHPSQLDTFMLLSLYHLAEGR
jgi:hypothetical protein